MSRAKQAILELLRKESPLYGLELVKRSEGRLKRGTVYVHLASLEDEGVVRSFEGEDLHHSGSPRRQYEITTNGRRKLIELETENENVGGLPEGSPA